VTKLDLIAGFNEFFASLSEAERGEVWGLTLPAGPDSGPIDPTVVEKGFAGLVSRLEALVRERLIAERDVERRALILGFPLEIRLLLEDIRRFLQAASAAWRAPRTPWIRGVYLTSGLQDGRPIDRLSTMLRRSVGVRVEPAPDVAGERAFFLRRLIHEVVLGEVGLVGRSLRRERVERRAGMAAATTLAVCVAGIIAGWTWSYRDNRDRELALERSLGAWSQAYGSLASETSARSPETLADVAPALDRLADLARDARAPSVPFMDLGLSRQQTLAAQADAAYEVGVRGLLLPRLLFRLERRLGGSPAMDRAALAEPLEVYLMLGGRSPPDTSLLTTWLAHDGSTDEQALGHRLEPHLAALVRLLPALADPPGLDEALVLRVQAQLAQQPPPNRAEAESTHGAAALAAGEPQRTVPVKARQRGSRH
jgi:type VI secretion system protein ImpL